MDSGQRIVNGMRERIEKRTAKGQKARHLRAADLRLSTIHYALSTASKSVVSGQWIVNRRRRFAFAAFLLLVLSTIHHPLSTVCHAQTGLATLNGQITDPHGRVVPSTAIEAINIDTGVVYPAKTNGVGLYSIASLPPGRYRVRVKREGFKEVNLTGLDLHTQDVLQQNFSLEVGSTSESVSVEAGATNDSPAVSMTVEREFIENMPLNGRSLQDLIQLAPGVVSTGNGNDAGYYSINGQRTDGNNYTVDGVSANLGGFNNTSTYANEGSALSGSTPTQTILGTTQTLASIDSLQEFTIQTSGYAAEYGRNPGGQVQFTTRSGTNDIHGSLFDYLRNTVFDANSYQNDYFGDPQQAEHQNDFGGTIGGPLIFPKLYNGKDKTFYFFSYEGLRLLLPSSENEYVPTQAFRKWASPNIQPFLNAQPLPTTSQGNNDGCTITDPSTDQPAACDALFYYGFSFPNNLDNYSIRVDQNLGKHFHGFVRYADTPSSVSQGVEEVSTNATNVHTWTAGLTANINPNLIDDLRFNFSRDGEESVRTLGSRGGAVPFSRDLLIPPQFDSPFAQGYFVLSLGNTALGYGASFSGTGSVQRQYQLVNGLTWTRGKHSYKLGVDWRRLTPSYIATPYNSFVLVDSLTAVQQGFANSVSTGVEAPGQPIFDNLSLYLEDHWKIGSRLTLDYGLRWEFNPPPGPSNGYYPVTLTSSDLASATLTSDHTQPYQTDHHSFAPRVGFAWSPISAQDHQLTVRGGFGIFFDTGQSTIGAAYAGQYPFAAYGPGLTDVSLPASAAALAPPTLNPNATLTAPYDYSQIVASDPGLTMPYTEQWNLSIDEKLNPKNTLTASYLGNNGKKLLFTAYYPNGFPGNPNFTSNTGVYTYNGAKSHYSALQIQDTGRIATGLDLVGSFTWAHSLDNSSNDYTDGSPLYGNSDYDLRRLLNLALNYQTSAASGSHWMRPVARGWTVSNRFSAQSGYPLNIAQGEVVLSNGIQEQYSPDLVTGVPIYLHGHLADASGHPVPGNWRLNSAAFALVPTDPTTGDPIRLGTLGRNYVRDPSFWALNTSVQRSFPVYENLLLMFRVDVFNLPNHPNLSNPDTPTGLYVRRAG